MKKKMNELILSLTKIAHRFATAAHLAVSQGLINWEQHENLMKTYRKMMREITKLGKELTQGDN